jgi:hypothetical protein
MTIWPLFEDGKIKRFDLTRKRRLHGTDREAKNVSAPYPMA